VERVVLHPFCLTSLLLEPFPDSLHSPLAPFQIVQSFRVCTPTLLNFFENFALVALPLEPFQILHSPLSLFRFCTPP
jgi:hypothetical protein